MRPEAEKWRQYESYTDKWNKGREGKVGTAPKTVKQQLTFGVIVNASGTVFPSVSVDVDVDATIKTSLSAATKTVAENNGVVNVTVAVATSKTWLKFDAVAKGFGVTATDTIPT
jgi:hypothetical protein